VFRRPTGRTLQVAALLYGIGMGLTFDEFGMWIHLGGSYWQRASWDAITVVAASFGPDRVCPIHQTLPTLPLVHGCSPGTGIDCICSLVHQILSIRRQKTSTEDPDHRVHSATLNPAWALCGQEKGDIVDVQARADSVSFWERGDIIYFSVEIVSPRRKFVGRVQ